MYKMRVKELRLKWELANRSWFVTENMTSATPDKVAGTSWKNVIVDENWEIMVWDVQRMTTRQTLTPTAIVTANPLAANFINASWMDYYVSTASFSSTTPTWWNSLYDFAWDCQYDFTRPNHGWRINWFITGTWITYRWPHDDWYTKDVNIVLWSIHGKAESSVQAAWTWLSLSVNIYHWVDTWIALLMAWWWISFWPYFSTAITFYPTN